MYRVKTRPGSINTGDNLGEDGPEWQDRYISPAAKTAIEAYLVTTGRNWEWTGPLWLTLRRHPLSYEQLRYLIREWLKTADCTYTNPSALRHTGIDRMLNKAGLPISVVQQISGHADAADLLKFCAPSTP